MSERGWPLLARQAYGIEGGLGGESERRINWRRQGGGGGEKEEGEGTRSEEKIIIRVSTVTRRKGEREEGRIKKGERGVREKGG